jgi:hypothetical protein
VIKVRTLDETDLNFLRHSWIKTAKKKQFVKPIEYSNYVNARLETAKTLIACDPEEPKLVIGYCIYDHELIYFCYVRKNFRELGVMRELFRHIRNDRNSTEEKLKCAFKKDAKPYRRPDAPPIQVFEASNGSHPRRHNPHEPEA